MDLLDFIFPEQAQASHLRDIAENSRTMQLRMSERANKEIENSSRIKGLNRRIEKLENDVAMLSMLNVLLVRKYVADTGKTPQELQVELKQVDDLDGAQDGGLDCDELRKLLGITLPIAHQNPTSQMCPDCNRVLSLNLKRCLYCGYVPNL